MGGKPYLPLERRELLTPAGRRRLIAAGRTPKAVEVAASRLRTAAGAVRISLHTRWAPHEDALLRAYQRPAGRSWPACMRRAARLGLTGPRGGGRMTGPFDESEIWAVKLGYVPIGRTFAAAEAFARTLEVKNGR